MCFNSVEPVCFRSYTKPVRCSQYVFFLKTSYYARTYLVHSASLCEVIKRIFKDSRIKWNLYTFNVNRVTYEY